MVTSTDVRRAYRLLLGRDPESDAVVAGHTRASRLGDLMRNLALSSEFAGRWAAGASAGRQPGSAEEVFGHFPPYTGPGTRGFVTDFLGVKTRTRFIQRLERLDGTVEPPPVVGNFHANAVEWAAVLRAVLDADGRLAVMELGAGWAPWLVTAAAAARRRGIADVRLTAVEASAGHLEFARQHFRDNGLDPDRHTFVHGAVAAADGPVAFPDVPDPAADYGASTARTPFDARPPGAAARTVPGYSLATLLAPEPAVDLLHVDVQGAEAAVVAAGRDALKAKVRWLVVGTHGRGIEEELFEELAPRGWLLEADEACRYGPAPGGLILTTDGCQVWRNPDL